MALDADPRDLLRQHLASAGTTGEALCTRDKEAYIGNVQYRPYTAKAFVKNEALRAVTLFDLDELVLIANSPEKAVILIARRRADDGRTRSVALRPLLSNPEMQLFSHLVIDEATARELLRAEG